MKKLLITALLISYATSFGAVYHVPTSRTFDEIPQTWKAQYPNTSNLPLSPYATDFVQLVPFIVPDGMEKIAGTQTYTLTDGVMVESWEVETQAEADARKAIESAPSKSLITSAWLFRAILQSHFGIGAETNTEVTAETVKNYFGVRRLTGTGAASDGQDLVILSEGFKLITEFTGDGTIWSFPWAYVPEELPTE